MRNTEMMGLAYETSLTSVKGTVAAILREEIITGRLEPGEPIVERKWATKLRVAQASVREALNVLAAEGFVQKQLARSARVTILSEKDLVQLWELRTVLECFAARQVAAKRPDLRKLEQM